MSSHFRIEIAAAALAIALALGACDQDQDDTAMGSFAPTGPGAPAQRDVALIPGGGQLADSPDPRARPYYGSAAAVTEGMRFYNEMNCVGCHFNGGGGIGPPLMDDAWIYGGRLDQIYDTIYFGRPNGMPAWGGKLTDDQIWKIATYVRSMSLPQTLARNDNGTPSQHPAPVPAEADAFDGWHIPEDYGG